MQGAATYSDLTLLHAYTTHVRSMACNQNFFQCVWLLWLPQAHHLLHSSRGAHGREGALAADPLSSRQAAVLATISTAMLCSPQAKANTQQKVAADGAQQGCDEGPLMDDLTAGVDTQGVQRLLTHFANTWDL